MGLFDRRPAQTKAEPAKVETFQRETDFNLSGWDDPMTDTPTDTKLMADTNELSPASDDQADQAHEGVVVSDVDARLAALARKVTSAKRKMVDSVLAIGESLAEAQALLADANGGSFGKWLKAKCNFTRKTAYRYIKAWQTFGQCDAGLQRRFDVSALTVLAEESTPAAAVQEAIGKAGDGERITGKLAKAIIAQHKPKSAPKGSKPEPIFIETATAIIVIRPKAEGVDAQTALAAALRSVMSQKAA